MRKPKKQYNNLSELYKTFNDNVKIIADKNRFPYIYTKASIYLKSGAEIYRKNDFYKMPDKSWDDEEMAMITVGCQQIIQGKGLTEDNPFTALGVTGFYKLFTTFHFESKSRITKRKKLDGKTYFIDIIDFEHVVDHSIVTYCNMVTY
jgi:hypothetical protein